MRGETDGGGIDGFAVAGTKTPGAARGEDRENCAELFDEFCSVFTEFDT